MGEIENVSDQLLAFMEEVNHNIEKMKENNLRLTYDQCLELAKIAVQDQRNDVLWKRLREINENLQILNENLNEISKTLEELGENLCNN